LFLEQQISILVTSEEPYDTEDWSNDDGNSALPSRKQNTFQNALTF